MMLDLFIKLVNKLIEVAKERQRIKKSFHDDFMIPIINQFEAVHKEYISSFKNYRDLVSEQSPNLDKNNNVFLKLESDMIFSYESRVKLAAMCQGLNPFLERMYSPNPDNIEQFFRSLASYINNISDAGRFRYDNQPRESMLTVLEQIVSGEYNHPNMSPSQLAERTILEKMWEMQDIYSNIQYNYQRAKTDILR